MGSLFHLLHAVAAQDPVENAGGIADLLERGGVGVAALAILGLVAMFVLYVRQSKYYDKRLDKVRDENSKEFQKQRDELSELQKDTTGFLKDVAHSLQDISKSLERRDAEVLRKVDTLLERIPNNAGGR